MDTKSFTQSWTLLYTYLMTFFFSRVSADQ